MSDRLPSNQFGNVRTSELRTPRQNFQVSTRAFGSRQGEMAEELGRDMNRVSNQMWRAAQLEKTNEDNARVKDGEKQLGTFARDAFYLNEDAYYKKKGLDAMQGYDPVAEAMREQRDVIMETLDNEAQKNAFFERSEAYIEGKLNEAARYRMQESEGYQNGQSEAIIESTIEESALNGNLDNIVANAARGQAEINALAERNGWSAEETAWRQQQYESELWSRTINGMLETEPKKARELYERPNIKSKIFSEQRSVIEKNLDTQDLKADTFEKVDEIRSQHGRDQEAALAAARDIDDPDLREAVTNSLTISYNRDETIRNRQQKEANEAGWNMALTGANLEALPASVLNAMTPDARASLQQFLRERSGGKQIQTNWSIYDQMIRLRDSDPNEFAKLDLSGEYRHVLSNGHLEQLIKSQSEIRTEGPPDPLSPVATLSQQISAATNQMGLVGQNYAEERGAFHSAVQAEASRQEGALGRELTFEENQKIIDHYSLVVSADIPWEIRDDIDEQFLFELDTSTLTAEQRAAFIVPLDRMPPEFETTIRGLLQQNGITNASDKLVQRVGGLYALRDTAGLQDLIVTERANATPEE